MIKRALVLSTLFFISQPSMAVDFAHPAVVMKDGLLASTVGILSAGWSDADLMTVRHASIEQYRLAGMQYPFDANVTVELKKLEGGVVGVNITAQVGVDSRGLEILIEVSTPSGVVIKPIELFTSVLAQSPSTSVNTKAQPSNAVSSGKVQSAHDNADRQIVVAKGDSLYRIAGRLAPTYHSTAQKVYRALVAQNKEVLVAGEDYLKIGQVLSLPEAINSDAEVKTLSAGLVVKKADLSVKPERLVVSAGTLDDMQAADTIAKQKELENQRKIADVLTKDAVLKKELVQKKLELEAAISSAPVIASAVVPTSSVPVVVKAVNDKHGKFSVLWFVAIGVVALVLALLGFRISKFKRKKK